MSSAPTAPPPTRRSPSSSNATQPGKAPGFKNPTKTGRGWSIIINAVEGWGKTSMAARATNSALIMAPRETGYITLFDNGLAPERPYAVVESWPELLAQLDAMKGNPDGIGALCLDALGGLERLCHEYVCQTEFNGDWGEKGFVGYQRGYDISIAEWLKMLARLDVLRQDGMNLLLLSHCRIKGFKNPLGPDYDRYASDLHDKTWGVTHKWVGAVMFGTFYQVVEEDRKKRHRGIGGTERVLYTQRTDAWDAKNLFGLSEPIDIPSDPDKVWDAIREAMKTKGGK